MSSIVPSHPYLELVSAYQVSGHVARVDELILGFWVLNGVWSFSGMAPRIRPMNITSDSCLKGNTTHGLRKAWSPTGLSLIVGVQHLKNLVSFTSLLHLWVTPLIVISAISAESMACCVCKGLFDAPHFRCKQPRNHVRSLLDGLITKARFPDNSSSQRAVILSRASLPQTIDSRVR